MERRNRRSDAHHEALYYQLDTSCQRAALEAMVLADQDGLCVASSGDPDMCDEIAAHMAMLCEQDESFVGTVAMPDEDCRHVQMRRFAAQGTNLYLCAVGGDPRRSHELDHSMTGVTRILAS